MLMMLMDGPCSASKGTRTRDPSLPVAPPLESVGSSGLARGATNNEAELWTGYLPRILGSSWGDGTLNSPGSDESIHYYYCWITEVFFFTLGDEPPGRACLLVIHTYTDRFSGSDQG